MLANARHLVAMPQRRQDGRHGVETRRQVRHRVARLHGAGARLAIGHAGDAHQAAHGLEDGVVAGQVAIGAGLAESGNRAIHQPGIDRGQ
ncbi:hypothetical protein D3C78_1542610 [compost metagenome]